MRDLSQQEVNAVSGGGLSDESAGTLVGGFIGSAFGGGALGGMIGGFIGGWLGSSGAVSGGRDIRLKYAVQ